MLKYLIFILMFIACCNTYTPLPQLEDYVSRYEKATNTKVTTNIKFVPPTPKWTENRWAGVCYMYTVPQMRHIELNEESWDRLSDTSKYILVSHELGHCQLDREHSTEKYRGFPVSIMYPILLDEWIFSMLESEYMNELVTGDSKQVKDGIDKILKERYQHVNR